MANWGRCDFEQLKRLQKQFERLQDEEFDKFCKACAKELAARLLAKVIKRTPVADTVRHLEDRLDENGNPETHKRGKNKGKAKQRSVVDHVGGTLRRGWISRTEAEAVNGSGKAEVQEQAAFLNSVNVTKAGGSYQIEIVNPVNYASYVEYGHRQTPGRYVPAIGKRLKKSWAKGKFMLTISEQELQSQAPQILERKLARFFEDCLND